MNAIKKTLFLNGLKKFSDKLDKKDLEFVARITSDPDFDRLMGKVTDGDFIAEAVRGELSKKMA